MYQRGTLRLRRSGEYAEQHHLLFAAQQTSLVLGHEDHTIEEITESCETEWILIEDEDGKEVWRDKYYSHFEDKDWLEYNKKRK